MQDAEQELVAELADKDPIQQKKQIKAIQEQCADLLAERDKLRQEYVQIKAHRDYVRMVDNFVYVVADP